MPVIGTRSSIAGVHASSMSEDARRWQVRPFVRWAILCAALGVLLHWSASDLRRGYLLVYFFVYAGSALAGILAKGPSLQREWTKPGSGSRDRLMVYLQVPILCVHWVLGGLDVGRLGYSIDFPKGLWVAGCLLFVLSVALRCWSMRINEFYSSVVRLQSERGHTLIDRGPYQFVRHPGYLSAVVNYVSSGLAMGSWLSLIPILIVLPLYPRRIVIEERLLVNELPGYRDYTKRVPYRLIPFVW